MLCIIDCTHYLCSRIKAKPIIINYKIVSRYD